MVHPHHEHRWYRPFVSSDSPSIPRSNHNRDYHLHPRRRPLPPPHLHYSNPLLPFPWHLHPINLPPDRKPFHSSTCRTSRPFPLPLTTHSDVLPHNINPPLRHPALRRPLYRPMANHHPSHPLLDLRNHNLLNCNPAIPPAFHW